MKKKGLSVTEIEEKIRAFVKHRDRNEQVTRNTYKPSLSTHMKNARNDMPLCHHRKTYLNVSTDLSEVDCTFCLKIIAEEEKRREQIVIYRN